MPYFRYLIVTSTLNFLWGNGKISKIIISKIRRILLEYKKYIRQIVKFKGIGAEHPYPPSLYADIFMSNFL